MESMLPPLSDLREAHRAAKVLKRKCSGEQVHYIFRMQCAIVKSESDSAVLQELPNDCSGLQEVAGDCAQAANSETCERNSNIGIY